MESPKIPTDLLWTLTYIFVGLGVVCFSLIYFFRNKSSFDHKKKAAKKKELTPMISEFLFYEDTDDKEDTSRYLSFKLEVRELLKDAFNRKVMAEILLDLYKDVSGDIRTKVCDLYKNLGLHEDAFQRLKSWKWAVIAQGILELTQMEVEEAYGFIIKFLNHRTKVVRRQAEIGTVSLRPDGLNHFLDTTRYKISEWQQLKLLDVLRNFDDYQAPKFSSWLTSNNTDVVLFAMRLIKYYNQSDACASITELVKHKNNHIKIEAIDCIKKFGFFDARPTLKMVFKKNNASLKVHILDAIGYLGMEEDIAFLREVNRKENDFIVTSKALSAINDIVPETILPTKDIETFNDEEQYSVPEANIDHIEDTSDKELSTVMVQVTDDEQPLFFAEDNIQNMTLPEGHDSTILKNNQNIVAPNEVVQTNEENISEPSPLNFELTNSEDIESIITTSEVSIPQEIEDKEEDIMDYYSIFKPLFDSSDRDCKLILLQEMEDLGDHKEIPFLTTLSTSDDKEIAKKAASIKDIIIAKIAAEEENQSKIAEENTSFLDSKHTSVLLEQEVVYSEVSQVSTSTIVGTDFTLNENGESKAQSLEKILSMDFELAEEFFDKTPIETNKESKEYIDQESLMNQFLSWSSKITDKLN